MNLAYSLAVIFAIIFLGAICRKLKLFNQSQIEGFELFLFKVSIPCYLFSATLKHKFSELVNIPYIYSYILCFVSIALITCIYFWRDKPLAKIGIKMLASGYVNAAIYSLPVITFLLGDPKSAILSNLVQVLVIQSTFIILLNVLEHQGKSVLHRIIKAIATPLVLMPIIGLLLSYYQLNPHSVIITIIENLGENAASLALFTFGLTISNVKNVKDYWHKDVLFIVLSKNILHPVIAILIGAYIFHLDRYWLYSLIIVASAPTAFVVYLIAKQFLIEEDVVRMVVTISSIISLASLVLIANLI